jgi:hypothetical protein
MTSRVPGIGWRGCSGTDAAQLQEQLVDAFEEGEEDRAGALVAMLAEQSQKARAVLEEMLGSEDASVRRAAAFGLGGLSGTAIVKCLEHQLAVEEARNNLDGESVLEVIMQALGRIKETGARSSLIRTFKRLVAEEGPASSDVEDMVYALWRKRHSELIPVIQSAVEQLPSGQSFRLSALLRLLKTQPQALATWILDTSASLREKTGVLTILDEEIPDELLPVVSAFITAANALPNPDVKQDGDGSYYCNRLFTTILEHSERVLPALPAEARSELRALARKCVASRELGCALRAAVVLGRVGRPKDARLLEVHRPVDPGFAKVFDDAVESLKNPVE